MCGYAGDTHINRLPLRNPCENAYGVKCPGICHRLSNDSAKIAKNIVLRRENGWENVTACYISGRAFGVHYLSLDFSVGLKFFFIKIGAKKSGWGRVPAATPQHRTVIPGSDRRPVLTLTVALDCSTHLILK